MLSWEVVAPGPLLALTALSLLAWGAWSARHRRHRGGVVLGLAVLLSLLAAGDGVDRRFAYLPRVGDLASVVSGRGDWPVLTRADLAAPDPLARHPDGGVLTVPVPDSATGVGAGSALVWLPPQYLAEPARRFPVVYLLHGSPGVPADWLRGGEAADTGRALAAHGLPAILVLPRLSRGWLDDPECVDGLAERAETHFWRDVVPAVDAAVRTAPGREARAIAGMSAGGFCALNLGLKHRDRVATVLDLSGLTSPTHRGGIAALYGAPGATARAALDSPAHYAPRLASRPSTRVWLDTGAGDAAVRAGLERIAPVLAARGVEVQLHVRPGAHTFHVWRPALAEALAWALPGMEAAAGGTSA